MPTFCRHNRLEATCPICSRKAKAAAAPVRPPRSSAPRAPRPSSSVASRRRAARAAGDLRVRHVARAVEDGYSHELVPGLRASADAARLAEEVGFSAARLEELFADPPGLYADVALADDREEAIWLAFLIAWLGPPSGEQPFAGIEAARVPWSTGEIPDADGAEAAAAYRAWAARAGSQEAGLVGEPSWAPERRFERAFERLSVKGLRRAPRYEMLVSLGRLGVVDLRPTSLHLTEPLDPAMVAAKRVFGIGDAMNIRRRSAALAQGVGVPIEALDLALLNWGRPGEERITAGARVTGEEEAARIAALLGVEPLP